MLIEPMKALSLWQPWASLIAVGAKRYETRSWATKYRGPIVIHAAMKPYNLGNIDFALSMGIMNAAESVFGIYEANNLPLGVIVATAELVRCHLIWTSAIRDVDADGKAVDVLCAGSSRISKRSDEFLFGDWTPGRYAWELANVQLLNTPIPAKGRQGLWNWEGVQ